MIGLARQRSRGECGIGESRMLNPNIEIAKTNPLNAGFPRLSPLCAASTSSGEGVRGWVCDAAIAKNTKRSQIIEEDQGVFKNRCAQK
jgi:hypothetical protein